MASIVFVGRVEEGSQEPPPWMGNVYSGEESGMGGGGGETGRIGSLLDTGGLGIDEAKRDGFAR